MQTPLLFHSDQKDPNFIHVTGFCAPDPMICLALGGRRPLLVANDLEFSRATKTSVCEVLCQSTKFKEQTSTPDMILQLLEEHGITKVFVTESFSCLLYQKLTAKGIQIEVVSGPLPTRRTKTQEEISFVEEANRASAKSFEAIREVLEQCAIENGTDNLIYNGEVLTSELMKQIVEITCIKNQATSVDTIVACGAQGADPHCQGSGPLKAHQLIVCDIFPRAKSNYFGDMTRTFLKGTPTDAQRALVEAVQAVHDECAAMVKPGVKYADVAAFCNRRFVELGYPREMRETGPVGMIHGLGHGVGLEIHEKPGVNIRTAEVAQIGDIFTIEPGLYYPEIGGCRVEDSFWIDAEGEVRKFQAGCSYDWVVE